MMDSTAIIALISAVTGAATTIIVGKMNAKKDTLSIFMENMRLMLEQNTKEITELRGEVRTLTEENEKLRLINQALREEILELKEEVKNNNREHADS